MTNLEKVRAHLDTPELLCQLAEEAAELSKAALKLRRAITGINPTPVTKEEALDNVIEEALDVEMVLEVLELYGGRSGINRRRIGHRERKFARWAERLEG